MLMSKLHCINPKNLLLLMFGITILIYLVDITQQNLPKTIFEKPKQNSKQFHVKQLVKRSTQAAKCYKKYQNQTYKVCEELPYLDIKCGSEFSQNKPKQDQPYVIPDVIFFIWFGANRTFEYCNYLSIRSAAAIHQPERIDFYYDHLPRGKHWRRAFLEIPCLYLVKFKMPTQFNGIDVPNNVQKTDIARLQLLVEHGGIYLDGDMILLKSLDPLRIHRLALGRGSVNRFCICAVLARKNSLFLREFYKLAHEKALDTTYKQSDIFTLYLGDFIHETKIKIHIEDVGLNRPNPYIKEDGKECTVFGNFDMSNNYLLHVHPERAAKSIRWRIWDEERLRKFDGVYGEAARIALFGSPDLIYKPGEEVHEMREKVQMFQFPPFIQKNAIVEDSDIDN